MSEMTIGIMILVGSLALMLIMGVEIAYALGLSAVFTCMYMGIDLLVVFHHLFINHPFRILSGISGRRLPQ